jgi:hypothetical protein
VSTPAWARAALTHPCFTGLPRQHLAALTVELAEPWTAAHQAALQQRRGHPRRRAAGAGPHHHLGFCDRVLVTLVILRFQLPHQALAVLYGVDRATVTRAVHQIRPLLARRGFAAPDAPGVRLHTLADVFAYAAAHRVQLRIDGTETQVRRPRANRAGRRAFVSGKKKQNTIKTTTMAFSARLRDEVDLDTQSAELLAMIDRTVQPTQASLWLRPRPSSCSALESRQTVRTALP